MGLKDIKSRAKINKQQVCTGLGVFQVLNSQIGDTVNGIIRTPHLSVNKLEWI